MYKCGFVILFPVATFRKGVRAVQAVGRASELSFLFLSTFSPEFKLTFIIQTNVVKHLTKVFAKDQLNQTKLNYLGNMYMIGKRLPRKKSLTCCFCSYFWQKPCFCFSAKE